VFGTPAVIVYLLVERPSPLLARKINLSGKKVVVESTAEAV
jgi:hypothetical protein